MKKFRKILNYWPIYSLIAAIAISIFIIRSSLYNRWFAYDVVPEPVTDEYDYSWQGLSLRRHGMPVGWTLWAGVYMDQKYNPKESSLDGFLISYEGTAINLNEFRKNPGSYYAVKEIDYTKGREHMFFATPFFDHPPLGGLIYSLGVEENVTQVDQVKPIDFRKPAIIMAVITSVLLFVFSFLITSNPWVSTLSVIIYSTVPTYVLATRTSFLENVISPLALIHLITLIVAVKKYKNIFWMALSGILCGVTVLAKESAVSYIVASFILLIINKVDRKRIIVFLLAAALPIITYVSWASWLNKDLFLGILLANAGREYFGAIKPVTMLEALKFKNFPTDGWWIWGILSFILVSYKIKRKELLFLVIPLSVQLITMFLLGSHNYPWYLISSIPLFAICSAVIIWRVISRPSFTSALAFFLVPFSSSYYWGRVALSLPADINHYRYSFLVFIFMLFVRIRYRRLTIVRVIWILFMITLIRKIVIFNQVFFPYMIAHWGNLPIPSLPNF